MLKATLPVSGRAEIATEAPLNPKAYVHEALLPCVSQNIMWIYSFSSLEV